MFLQSWQEQPVSEEELVQVAMLRHYAYCPRSCGLIFLEQVFDENVYTLEGKEGHERVDEPASGEVNGVPFERALPLFSFTLGLVGKADLVEFPGGVPYPVDYKRGGRSGRAAAEIQLCAQALCLEEMFQTTVPKGALYVMTTHRRVEVMFTPDLRARTKAVIREVRALLASTVMPPAVNDRRCTSCSLINICCPEVMAPEHRGRLLAEWNRSREPMEDL